ncbi:protein serine/threonine phosphatase [Denitrovibrio acetiphilus DSM 12809]|uniref:Protein serine/threonine phosphatase n=1 Tax=Denitrovibrio acetiphilus (strain DSM 12809 / NBRC 114555 / N2460) TaxID=522772 RepID=D4H4G9_DENA2|nr:SpoIIE family protein phosphatase [Denitrovibrio acetiphilus]ADD69298.1 protein serine/threonine phosphatase [Denitrovibrio acetiphilus DSM 12809]
MSTHKNILLFCGSQTDSLFSFCTNFPGIRCNAAFDREHFISALMNAPCGIILTAALTDEELLNKCIIMQPESSYAVVVSSEDKDKIFMFLKAGISTFIYSGETFENSLTDFLDKLLLADKKCDTLLKTLHKMRCLADNVDEGIVILDKHQAITYINAAGAKLLDAENILVTDKHLSDLIKTYPFEMDSPDNLPQHYDEFEFITASGKKITMTSTYSPTYDADEFAGAIVIFSTISEVQIDKKKELELLKYQQRYHSFQQNLAFQKQMLILQDEMSNIKTDGFSVETYFKPLDILSGDSYGSLNLKDGRYLFYIIDAMGKGLSASVTALQSTSFINHAVSQSIIKNNFDMEITISSFLSYIQARLMDEEALCCLFALLDSKSATMTIASYGIPPVYMVHTDQHVETIRPNNLPIMKYITTANSDTYDLSSIEKILMMSDGLTEAVTVDQNLYMDYLQEDLIRSCTKKHFLSFLNQRIEGNDDDITFFFIKNEDNYSDGFETYEASTSFDGITHLSKVISMRMEKDKIPEAECGVLEYAVSEILMNALEHGNLGIGFGEKQTMIAAGTYDETLKKLTATGTEGFSKKISVLYKYVKPVNDLPGTLYLDISDEGAGFTPTDIFKYHTFDGNLCHVDKERYNGRGIFIADNMVDALYYNEKGNRASIVKLIKPEA